MAQIDISTIEKIEKQKISIHELVHCTYSTFEFDLKKYVQLDMYGKSDRANPLKVSQSIQVDRKTAQLIVRFLVAEFNLDTEYNSDQLQNE